MLKKLLKYDIWRMAKKWKMLGGILAGCGIVFALCLRLAETDAFYNDDLNDFAEFLGIFGMVLAIFGIIAAWVFNMVFIGKYMGRDLFSDVGQLTFTIPVKRDVLFFSKFLNSLIWTTAFNVSLVVIILLCALIAPTDGSGATTEVFPMFAEGMLFEADLNRLLDMLILIIAVEIGLLNATLLNYCIIKCQSSGGIGMFIGLAVAGVSVLCMVWGIGAEGFALVKAQMSVSEYTAFVLISLFVGVIGLAVLNFSLFFCARDRLKYDFNLT